jgi:NMD protein affecting ribosome stability and mRNA decay
MKRMNERYSQKLRDPYMDKGIYKNLTVCPSCNLIFQSKRWIRDEALLEELRSADNGPILKKCPTCRKTDDRYPLGVLNLHGDYLDDHKDEILKTIRNEAEHEERRNPLARIIRLECENSTIRVETSTESLARRLGRVVNKAYQGELTYSFSNSHEVLRAEWHRD